MKTCSKCKSSKSLSSFNKNKGRKDGLQSYCRDCEKKRKKDYYSKNKDKFLSYNRKHKRRRQENWVEFKKTLECEQCGEDRWYVLDFHHLDPSKKEFEVSAAVMRDRTLEAVQEEIEKCKVLCANCHREEHHKLRCASGYAS